MKIPLEISCNEKPVQCTKITFSCTYKCKCILGYLISLPKSDLKMIKREKEES